MKQLVKVFVLVLALMLVAFSQSQFDNLKTSLHGTRQGKATFYNGTAENPGFHSLTGIDIEQLGCLGCHPSTGEYQNGVAFTTDNYDPLNCNNCHDASFKVDQPGACKTCHGRLGKQEALGMTDIHATKYGLKCSDCHSTGDIHGDGNSYTSMFDEHDNGDGTYDYPIDADCSNDGCHPNVASNPAHDQHGDDIHCSTCHTGSVVTCYNCHFNQMVDSHVKKANTALKGFMIIAHRTGNKYNGKIWPVSFQSLYYKTPDGRDTTFVTFVPYYSHNVLPKEEAKTCSDCHNNANVQAYNDNKELYIAKWDNEQGKIVGIQGVVPMPDDYKDVFKMDFVVQNTETGEWSPVGENTPDLIQNLGVLTPLTPTEMDKLSTPMGIEDQQEIAKSFKLKQNYPNPFNPTTTIEFFVPKAERVSLVVYNVLGEEVARVIDNQMVKAGVNKVKFDASNLNSGIYFYKLISKEVELTKKMVLVK